MAIPTCSKCGGHFFEVQNISPSGGNFKINLIQCSGCGVPVGTQEYFNLGTLLKKQETQISALANTLEDVERKLRGIEQALRK